MVQERLDQMIRGRLVQEKMDQIVKERLARNVARKNKAKVIDSSTPSCIIMVAMDKYSYDPREDFRGSMSEVIRANRISGPKELRCILNCYLSMNSIESRPIILQVFHEVCTDLFLYRKM
ncbi:hypothetical protein ACHQM5_002720 [Ranunculus cassubicifolius]